MYVHLKQSGELLTDQQAGAPWNPDDLYASAARIREVHANAEELGVEGLMVVSGAGNLVRGDEVRERFGATSAVARVSDAVGRMATAQNAIMLSAALTDYNVPHALFAAPGMEFADPHLGTIDPYDPKAVKEAYERKAVVLMLGGSGKDGQTTDAAVMDYTIAHGNAFPDDESMALKATKHPGIFTADPAHHLDATQFAMISAREMLERGLGGVDEQCLRTIAEAEEGVSLLVYAAAHSPLEVLRAERDASVRNYLGTVITSTAVEALVFEPTPSVSA